MNQSIYLVHPLATLEARDINKNLKRLLLARWLAGLLVIFLTAFCVYILDLDMQEYSLYELGIIILLYNGGLVFLTNHQEDKNHEVYLLNMRRLVLLQVALDWISMAVFIHLTGGISSPAITFFFIHVLIVTILLPGQSPYIYVVLAVFVTLGLATLENNHILSHHNVIPGFDCGVCFNNYYIFSQTIFLAIGLIAAVFVSSAIMKRLRERERQIVILLQNMQDVTSTLDLEHVLNNLARGVAEALNVPGSSIRLLSPDGRKLGLVASYGLSQKYLQKGEVELSQSILDREALSGQVIIIDHAREDSRMQYPREIAEEGIESLLVVPVIGQKPLGVLRVYSNLPGHFKHKDAEIVQTIAFQSASAIENAIIYDALQESEKQRTQFIMHITHELRAPVTGAKSLLRVLTDKLVGDLLPAQMDIVTRLDRRMDSLLSLIHDLLALSDSKMKVNQTLDQIIEIVPLVTGVVEQYQLQADQKEIQLSLLNGNCQGLSVWANEDSLKRIFENILDNAIKYTPPKGRVWVEITNQSGSITVRIVDTGIGIPSDEINQLGREFFRATNARQSDIDGTGLGIAIVKHLLDRSGGNLDIQSEPSKGTTVAITMKKVEKSRDIQNRRGG